VLRADGDVAACRQVRICAGQRDAKAEWLDDRRACRGPHAGPDLCGDCYADGLRFDFICGDEVYGSSAQLREFLEAGRQAYVLRVASSFMITLSGGMKLTCAEVVKRLVKDKRR
jgi:hypothetical protein